MPECNITIDGHCHSHAVLEKHNAKYQHKIVDFATNHHTIVGHCHSTTARQRHSTTKNSRILSQYESTIVGPCLITIGGHSTMYYDFATIPQYYNRTTTH